MQHPFPLFISKVEIKNQKQVQENNVNPYFSLLKVFVKKSSIVTLLQAAKYIVKSEGEMRGKWQDLPNELILKILRYSEVKDLVSCGQLSKRTRNISQDRSLWLTANLEKKIVKTEFIEMILGNGCNILNLSNSIIVGRLRRNMISQLRVLDLSQSAWGFPLRRRPAQVYYEDNLRNIEELLFSCCSLQTLKMEGLLITSKMAVSICKNGTTLEVLNLNHSFVVEDTFEFPGDFRSIIKCCQELKELDLNYVNATKYSHENEGLSDDDLEYLAENISSNVEKLKLIDLNVGEENVEIMLSRCNKIKVLTLTALFISDNPLKMIRQHLNLTLEELSLGYYGQEQLTSFLELKSMPRLKILNLYIRYPIRSGLDEEIQNLRQHLPHLMIRTF